MIFLMIRKYSFFWHFSTLGHDNSESVGDKNSKKTPKTLLTLGYILVQEPWPSLTRYGITIFLVKSRFRTNSRKTSHDKNFQKIPKIPPNAWIIAHYGKPLRYSC